MFFIVDIENGTMKARNKEAFHSFKKKNEGETFKVEFDDNLPSRTQKQNRFYWKYLEIIAEETGNNKDTLHLLFKNMFLSKGADEAFGKAVRKTRSTTDLNKKEFTEYIKQIERKTEIPAPDPQLFDLL